MNVKKHISARPVEKTPAPAAIPNRQFSGMALVITLILLSLITFMTVTFLIISQRERGSVSTTSDATTARFAADAALERAKAQIIAPIIALTNDQAYDMVITTNYLNRDGFVDLPSNVWWNVNYDFAASPISHPPLTASQLQTNIANLQYDARPPVYVRTNALFAGLELRFYIDLNRNGRYETNGWWPVLTGIAATPTYDLLGNMVPPASYAPPNVLSNFFIGDPEWIGQLEHPDQRHSGTNRFTSRYAFFAIPISKTLDINYIDNQAAAAGDRPVTSFEGYLRNEGVGSWELNLAAFLADLNTNQWNTLASPYFYRRPLPVSSINSGVAFDDALAIKSYRYNGDRRTLATIDSLYGLRGDTAVGDPNSVIDVYSDGDLQRTPMATNGISIGDNTSLHWAGADNTNHFFTTQDLLDPTKTSTAFTNRLAGAPGRSSYDRYTYYRLLSQMGTDSRAERGKININYVNVDDAGNIVPMLTTNFVRWGALQFFTNAADRVLKTYTAEWFKQNPSNYLATFYNIHTNFVYGTNIFGNILMVNSPYGFGLTNIPLYGMTNQIPSFGIHNIPVYMNGQKVYSASVHRLLQLTANIFDSTTNRIDTGYPYLPSVFRPVYYKTNDLSGNVFIDSFHEETDDTSLNLADATFDDLTPGVITVDRNVLGMPWIIGAKKGFPNFNQLTFETAIGVTRKLKAVKPSPTAPVNEIDQIYELGMTNYVVVSGWNSYGTPFPRQLELRFTNDFRYVVIGTNGVTIPSPLGSPYQFFMANDSIVNAGTWRGYVATAPGRSLTNFVQREAMLDNAVYDITTGPARFIPSTNTLFVSVKPGGDPMPKWVLLTTNRFKYALIDTSTATHHVVDYVNLDMSSNVIDITAAILASARCPAPSGSIVEEGDLWCTNTVTGSYPGANIQGVDMQLRASLGTLNSDAVWPDDGTKNSQITGFNAFFNNNNVGTSAETPYNPTYYTNAINSWQANDPLVHYTLDDLRTLPEPTVLNPLIPNQVNTRYSPWKGNPVNPNPADAYNLQIKDPLATNSMAWDFPTNQMPNVGWLGRVHRGTPWQTVYLKPQDPAVSAWALWSGHQDTNEAARTIPSEDRLLFDVFTTAINDNATRGQLSVNQTGLADWSAVLSGVDVLTNNMTDASLGNPRTPTAYGEWFIEPAGLYSAGNMTALARIWAGINAARASSNFNNTATVFPDKLFAHVGDVLATPELTVSSPFLNTSTARQLQAGISDEAYERIPQQIMGLLTLKHEPRYVIYSFGQALRPADHSIVMSGPMFGLCTNYQVTGETVTRAVVRIENAPRPGQPNQSPRAVLESFNILPPD